MKFNEERPKREIMENCDYSKEKRVIEYLSNITSDTTHTTTSDTTPATTPATNVDESSKDNTMDAEMRAGRVEDLCQRGKSIHVHQLFRY